MKTKNTYEEASHFNQIVNDYSDFKFVCIKKMKDSNETENKLLSRQAYWIAELRNLNPYELNKRRELWFGIQKYYLV